MRTSVLALLAIPLFTCTLWVERCAAQSTAHDMEARALFEAGRVAFVDERYADALGYFERAHELSGRPELLYNIATALDRLDRDDEALVQYEAYLAAVPDSEHTDEINFRLELLRGRLERDRAAAEAARTTTATSSTATRTSDRPTEGRTIRAGEPVTDAPSGGGDVTSEAWFWVLIGAVVVGAGVGITVGVIASQDPGEGAFVTGPDGRVIMTLTGTF
jgi:PAS domain-containing protein